MKKFSGADGDCVNFMSYLVESSASIVHADIRALEQYWQELRAGRACPFRAEVDPRDIRSKIGNLFILEDLGLGNIRFRIAGTALTDAFGIELRGMPVRSIMEMRGRESLAELLAETMAEPGVGYARLRRSGTAGELWEMILLPLRSDQGRIDRVIGALHRLDSGELGAADAPMRFVIDEMSISPVDVTVSALDLASEGGVGFADPAARYVIDLSRPGRARPTLTAIDGGCKKARLKGEHRQGYRRCRAHLRVVKSD